MERSAQTIDFQIYRIGNVSMNQYSETSEERPHLGTGCLVLVERLDPSRRFSFKFIVCHCNPPHNDRA